MLFCLTVDGRPVLLRVSFGVLKRQFECDFKEHVCPGPAGNIELSLLIVETYISRYVCSQTLHGRSWAGRPYKVEVLLTGIQLKSTSYNPPTAPQLSNTNMGESVGKLPKLVVCALGEKLPGWEYRATCLGRCSPCIGLKASARANHHPKYLQYQY